ncbi:hypothetical protein GQX74_006020 [Glossina fuscipes]|nr:hypothetical protein GQX74_006020 [Glossina fuscipes]
MGENHNIKWYDDYYRLTSLTRPTFGLSVNKVIKPITTYTTCNYANNIDCWLTGELNGPSFSLTNETSSEQSWPLPHHAGRSYKNWLRGVEHQAPLLLYYAINLPVRGNVVLVNGTAGYCMELPTLKRFDTWDDWDRNRTVWERFAVVDEAWKSAVEEHWVLLCDGHFERLPAVGVGCGTALGPSDVRLFKLADKFPQVGTGPALLKLFVVVCGGMDVMGLPAIGIFCCDIGACEVLLASWLLKSLLTDVDIGRIGACSGKDGGFGAEDVDVCCEVTGIDCKLPVKECGAVTLGLLLDDATVPGMSVEFGVIAGGGAAIGPGDGVDGGSSISDPLRD